ncbi:MAG: hypothetical protein EXX96DRAFT_585402, partial [Benjaminiella poitrasii]
MTSKDLLDQIRDLQCVIDSFAAENTVSLSAPTKEERGEEKVAAETDAIEDEKTDELKPVLHQKEDKTLVEPILKLPKPISICKLNLSDDFSLLVNQFQTLKVSPDEIKTFDLQPQHNIENEKTQVKEEEKDNNNNTKKEEDKSFLNQHQSPAAFSSQLPLKIPKKSSRRRTSSVSSKRSQKSTKSNKSTKSVKSSTHKKKQQQKNLLVHQPQEYYIRRSYDEMMRIPDIYERLSFYENTLDLCLKEVSPIAKWVQQNKTKGKPEALMEDYSLSSTRIRRERLVSSSSGYFRQTNGNNASTSTLSSMGFILSGSISTFLKKKVSANHSTPVTTKSCFSKPHNNNNKSSIIVPCPSYSADKTNAANNNSNLFGRSISRFNNISTNRLSTYNGYQQPSFPKKYNFDSHAPPISYAQPLNNSNNNTNRIASLSNKRPPTKTLLTSLSTKDYQSYLLPSANRSHMSQQHTSKSSTSTPNSDSSGYSFGRSGSMANLNYHRDPNYANSSPTTTTTGKALEYIVSVLPQVDISILQTALNEAQGDPMAAISIAVSHNKQAHIMAENNFLSRAASRQFHI